MTNNGENLPATIEERQVMTTNEARKIAKELVAIVKELNWSKNFGGEKDHLEIDAWQFIAAKDGTTPSISDTKEIFDKEGNHLGFKAIAELLRNSDGECLSRAEHECTIEEANWQNKPRYSLLGMAETRAMSRVCRNRYSWIARMGGFSGTPADEMDAEFVSQNQQKPSKPMPPPKRKSSPKPHGWEAFWQQVKERWLIEFGTALSVDERDSVNEFIANKSKTLKMSKTNAMSELASDFDAFIEEWKQWRGNE